MHVNLNEKEILAEFDRRHAQGVIFYDDEPRLREEKVGGFTFEFAVTAAISKKPYIKDNGDEPAAIEATHSRSPGFAPGSDIDVSGYDIADVSATHLVAFNKFCMYRAHLLLLTKDGHRRQYFQLDLQDMEASWAMLEALGWRYFMFFNCGKDGGCSRLHKHMQLAPLSGTRLVPWPAATLEAMDAPYRYLLRRFDPALGPRQITDLYEQMMVQARAILGLGDATSTHVPHNVALGRDWILVIPRRKAGVGGAYANTLGMLGMVSVANDEELRCWLEQGPVEVLSQLGVPQNSVAQWRGGAEARTDGAASR